MDEHGASGDAPVLRDLVNNESKGIPEDDDLALAKALQEQERAMWMLASGRPSGFASRSENAFFYRGQQAGPSQVAQRVQSGASAGPAGAEGSDADGMASGSSDAAEGESEGAGDDEELARRLQEEEEREHYARMMQMAGFGAEGEEEEEEGYISDDSVDPDTMTYEELQRLGESVGTVSRGMSAELAAALPLAKFGACAATQRASDDEQCAVCRMEFERGEEVKLLPCKHFYHPDCINQWLNINKVCPVCHTEVTQPAVAPPGGRPEPLGQRQG
ncbi:hypothetical protein WJX72_003943 [[Myrmecia] bisecta]|uniref:RING-type domain-containing protein n=1 Tax=[Myrmecia] bisecta TaxID=41462 RepID=A0AAW1PIU1_9CHLO